MLDYSRYEDIAYAVYESLGIPEDQYLQFKNDDDVRSFTDSYSREEITDLVEAELANYDTSENHPAEISDIRASAIDEVMYMIGENEEKYYYHKRDIMSNTYADIITLLSNSSIPGIAEVSSDYEPADPSVGIYGEERSISIKLTTGDYIYFNVEFDD